MNKQDMRELMKTKRSALSKNERELASCEIFKKAADFINDNDMIFVYINMGDEIDTSMYFESYKNTCVPRCFKGGLMKAITHYSQLERTPFGPMEPVDGIESDHIDVAIVPGLAFSTSMDRIGYGGGFYDRFLNRHPDIIKIGVCYDCQITDDFQAHDYDVKLDYIITEKRVIRREA